MGEGERSPLVEVVDWKVQSCIVFASLYGTTSYPRNGNKFRENPRNGKNMRQITVSGERVGSMYKLHW